MHDYLAATTMTFAGPALQDVFGTASLGARELLVLALFPFMVWGSDELRRWLLRRSQTAAVPG